MDETANQSAQCQRCGAPLPSDAPEGLCPRCLVALNLTAPTEIPDETAPHGTKVVEPPPTPGEIARHFPQFQTLECLGRGGMGLVYKARQPKLNRIVALKILAPERVAETRFAERFEREAQALARLNHPNIVTVYDFGEADGLYYLLMEYVDGVSLRQLLQNRKITPEEALAIVPKICEALQFAHEQGIVHRDIKPENVLLDKQGRVKIADFGIAKIVGGTEQAIPSPGVTATPSPSDGERAGMKGGGLTQDQVLGTPNYMAPEQMEKPQLVDHRADIYSLGVVFYEMLTGELPVGKFQPPSKKVHVDVRLDEVVLHALEKEPERRYQQVSEVKSDVETIATTPSSASVQQPTLTPTELKRGRWLIIVRAFAMCVAGGIFGAHVQPSSLGIAIILYGLAGFVFVAWKSLGSGRGKANDRVALKLANQVGLIHAIGVLSAGLVMALFNSGLNQQWNAFIASLFGFGIGISIFRLVRSLTSTTEAGSRVDEKREAPLPPQTGRLRVEQVVVIVLAAALSATAIVAGLPPGFLVPVVVFCLLAIVVTRLKIVAAPIEPPAGARITADAWMVVVIGLLIAAGLLTAGLVRKGKSKAILGSLPPPAQAVQLLNFGPVREVTLNDVNDRRGDDALDLDSGKLLDQPKEMDTWIEFDKLQWLKTRGVDVILSRGRVGWALTTYTDNKLELASLRNDRWNAVTEEILSQALAAGPGDLEIKHDRRGVWCGYYFADTAPPPLTFAFRTGSGVTGLLQITGFTKQPNSAQLRYKLVQPMSQAAAGQKSGKGRGGFGDAMPKMTEDPEMLKIVDAALRRRLDETYAPLIKQMNLTPEEAGQFKELLLDDLMKTDEKIEDVVKMGEKVRSLTSRLSGGGTTNRTEKIATRDEVMATLITMEAELNRSDEQLRQLLGDDRYAQYKDYQQTVGERNAASDSNILERLTKLAEDQRPAKPKSAAATTNATPVTAGQKSGKGRGGFGDAMRKMREDPEMLKMMDAAQRRMLDEVYDPLIKQMGLTPEEAGQFKELLLDDLMNIEEKALSLVSPLLGGGTTNRTEKIATLDGVMTTLETMEAELHPSDEQLRQLLGDDRYAQYEDYQQTVGERAQLAQFRMQTGGGENAFTDQQTEQLVALMREEEQAVAAATGQTFPGAGQDAANLEAMRSGEFTKTLLQSRETINQRVYERAREVLSPEQLVSFGKFQSNQLQMIRMGLTMMAPGEPDGGQAAPQSHHIKNPTAISNNIKKNDTSKYSRRIYLKLPLLQPRFHWKFTDKQNFLKGELSLTIASKEEEKEITIFKSGNYSPDWEQCSCDNTNHLSAFFKSKKFFEVSETDRVFIKLYLTEDAPGIGAEMAGTLKKGTYTSQTQFKLYHLEKTTGKKDTFAFLNNHDWEVLWKLEITDNKGWMEDKYDKVKRRKLKNTKHDNNIEFLFYKNGKISISAVDHKSKEYFFERFRNDSDLLKYVKNQKEMMPTRILCVNMEKLDGKLFEERCKLLKSELNNVELYTKRDTHNSSNADFYGKYTVRKE